MNVTLAQNDDTEKNYLLSIASKNRPININKQQLNMELEPSLPGRLFWAFSEITATNQKLQELGVQAETSLCEAKQKIGIFKEHEKYEDIAKNDVKGALDKRDSI